MAMVVNNNIPALMAYNNVNRTSNALQKSIQKLSSGLRINSAADDAAGLAISEKMRAQIRGLDQAVRNSQDGVSMLQTAEGALTETHSILQRMRELSVQSANDTLTQQDRGYIQLEIDQLREEVTRIGNTTQFNKKKLLDGSAAVLWSTDKLETKAIVKGGLRQIDQFGQKNALEGNFNIKIKAEPGQAEVQKSDIFKIKHKDVLMDVSLNNTAGIKGVRVDNVPAGNYEIGAVAVAAANNVTGMYGFPSVYSSSTFASEDLNTTPILAAQDGHQIQININGSAFGGVITLNTNDNGAALLTKINAAIAGATQDGFRFSASEAAGVVTLETFSAGSATAHTITVTDAGGGGGVAVTFPGAAADSVNQPVNMTTLMTVTPTAANLTGNASVLFEVTNVNPSSNSVSFKATANILEINGRNSTTSTEFTLVEGTALTLASELLGANALNMELTADMARLFEKGNKFVYNFSRADGADVQLAVSGSQNSEWPLNWGGGVTDTPVHYGLSAAAVAGRDIHLNNFYLNEKSGDVMEGSIVLTTDATNFSAAHLTAGTALANFEAAFVGQVAKEDVALRDLEKFWDAQGRFMLADPQTLTITQGNGKQTNITLYANDTLGSVAKKLNDAVGTGLGQARYVDDANNFVTFVDTKGAGSEAVKGTYVIRSVVAGESGKLSFAGDEDVVNALSLNVIQNAKESNYTVDIRDAHTEKSVVNGAEVTGNKLIGVLNTNIDVEFDAMAGVTANWNNSRKEYLYTSANYTTTLHLADNTTVYQIGANEGEDMGVNIGDMRSDALGLNKVLVTDRNSAARSITIIDAAIDKVSSQRARLGAYQNRLEHTITNLTVAGENLTSAESRIRDTDMAKEMLNFTRFQIMMQAGTNMLAQANQLPQNVMSLMR